MRRSSWKIDLEVSVRLDGVVYHLRVWIFFRRRPDGEAEFAAGFEDTERFGAGPLGSGKWRRAKLARTRSKVASGKGRFCASPSRNSIWGNFFCAIATIYLEKSSPQDVAPPLPAAPAT